jgi:hypothetical protein
MTNMKNILAVCATLMGICVGVACNMSIGNTPTAALKKMTNDLKSNKDKLPNFDDMLCKQDATAINSMKNKFEALAKLGGKDLETMIDTKLKEGLSIDNIDDITFKNEKITGDNATVDIVSTKDSKITTLHMVKENGAWKVCEGIADKMNIFNAFINPEKSVEAATGLLSDTATINALKKLGESPEIKKLAEDLKKKIEELK